MKVEKILRLAVVLLLALTGCKSREIGRAWPAPSAINVKPIPPSFKNGKVTIRAINGEVAKWNGERWAKINPGEVFSNSSILRTGKESWVDMSVNGTSSTVRLGPEAEMAFDTVAFRHQEKIGEETRTVLLLRDGGMAVSVRKLSATSSFEVQTANIVAQVRGTDFAVCAGGKVMAVYGQVMVLHEGKSYLLHDSEAFNSETKKVSEMDERLLIKFRGDGEDHQFRCIQPMDSVEAGSPFDNGLAKGRSGWRPPNRSSRFYHSAPTDFLAELCQ